MKLDIVERRQYNRYHTWLRGWIEGDNITLFGQVSNVSKGGFVIVSPSNSDIGKELNVNLILGEKGQVKAKGKIAWQKQNNNSWNMGIQFININNGEEKLEKFLKEYPRFLIQNENF